MINHFLATCYSVVTASDVACVTPIDTGGTTDA
jgi:hypothetical protein